MEECRNGRKVITVEFRRVAVADSEVTCFEAVPEE
jgi:hypothetical protein